MRPALLDPLPLADRVRTARRPGVCTTAVATTTGRTAAP